MTVTVNLQENSVCSLKSDDREWFAGLDVSAGGNGLNPNPHELLDSALGACTALTLEFYAKRKSYALTGVHVEVDHVEEGGVYRLHRRIQLIGDLTDEVKADLLRVANKCPIHKALSGQFEINSELV